MYIEDVSILYGKDLEYENTSIGVYGNRFTLEKSKPIINGQGLMMIPALINAHTHIGDSIAKDVALDLSFDHAINPISSIKKNVLEKSVKSHLIRFMSNAILSMLKRGITAFADFREGSLEGIELLRKANEGINARAIILGRVQYYFSIDEASKDLDLPDDVKEEARMVIKNCDGLGISGANEYSDKALRFFNSIRQGKLLAIHASESSNVYERSIKSFGKSDLARIMENLKPDILVHMTNAKDLSIAANSNIVVCPRANAVLGVGIPDIKGMLDNGCKIAIGTDNIMLNSPDLFREMDYLFKVSRALGYKISAKDVLKMATVNAADMLNLDSGYIDNGRLADAIFIDKHSIDLEPMNDPYAAIIHRVDASNIRAVMMDGKIVYGCL